MELVKRGLVDDAINEILIFADVHVRWLVGCQVGLKELVQVLAYIGFIGLVVSILDLILFLKRFIEVYRFSTIIC
jgi:hypothetical protein